MSKKILQELGIYVCDCGTLLYLPSLKDYQYDLNKKQQHYICPCCKKDLDAE